MSTARSSATSSGFRFVKLKRSVGRIGRMKTESGRRFGKRGKGAESGEARKDGKWRRERGKIQGTRLEELHSFKKEEEEMGRFGEKKKEAINGRRVGDCVGLGYSTTILVLLFL